MSISTERRNILKVLVRSSDPLPLMERIGSTSDGTVGSPEGAIPRTTSGGSFSTVSTGARKGITLLQPRVQNALWRMSMWFESDSDCEVASQHVELRRIQVRHEKLRTLKALLEAWGDGAVLNPDDEIDAGGML